MFLIVVRRLFLLALVPFFLVASPSGEVDIVRQASDYINNLNYVYSEFVQVSGGKTYKGKFWLKREKGKVQSRISYTAGVTQDIFVDGKEVVIKNEKKARAISISNSPIYSVLSGKLNLNREQIETLENTEKSFVIKILGYMGGDLILLFSKYDTGNVKDWEGWIFSKGEDETLFSFDPETWSVNNKTFFSPETFER